MWKVISNGEFPDIMPRNNDWEQETSAPVLVLDKWLRQRVAVYERFDSDEPFKWYTDCSEHWDIDGTVTHWQYLPELPKE